MVGVRNWKTEVLSPLGEGGAEEEDAGASGMGEEG